MGAGKSTVGVILSGSIGYKFVELDSLIEKTLNEKIPDIFSKMGEAHFRNLETDSLINVAKESGNTVISTGGGIVLKPENMKFMESTGTSIYLKTDIETIWERIKNDKVRPLLDVENPYKTANELLEGRKELYDKADITVETDRLSPQKISEKIIELLFN